MRIIKIIFSLNFLYILLIAAQIAAIVFLCLYMPAVIPLAAAYAGAWLLSFTASVLLLARRGGAEGKCAWFALVASLPVAGPVIYFIAGAESRACGRLKINSHPLTPEGRCAQEMCGSCDADYDSAEYFSDGAEYINRMLDEISRAEKSVYLEFYIVSGGKVFDRLIKALSRAALNGAEIKLIADGVGSAFKLKRREIKKLKAAGAEVKIFRRITPFPHSRLGYRDHRKIACVDGKAAFTGGINLSDEYAGITRPHGVWKDSGVAVYGGAAKVFEAMFMAMWTGKHERSIRSEGKKLCLPYCDGPHTDGFCENLYARKINAAKERVHIMTPYFCVGEKLASALGFAALRGVDVKIILPHVPDKPYAFELSKASARPLQARGVKFYEYTPGFMHSKTVICDGEAFLGSYNFDFRSARVNYECGIMFKDGICGDAETDFGNCLAKSSPLSEGKISPFRRFSRFLLRLFAPLM